MEDETVIVSRFKSGNYDALNWLINKYLKSVTRYISNIIRGVGGQQEDTEELAQDTFMAAWNGRETLKGKFSSWLFRIAKYKACNFVRIKRGLQEISLDEPISDDDEGSARCLCDVIHSHYPTPEEVVVMQEEQKEKEAKLSEISKAIEKLPPQAGEAFQHRRLEELKIKEVAEIMGLSEGTVKRLVNYAEQKLRKFLLQTNIFC
ncbi:MAG: RNA polymerase sigma factor [Nitrospirae bacterium]|nr:RNA polymerase sigma factor [Nitrospirota bacterium]